ncbi:phage DNA packaging protein J [Streptomyces goshikiensis]
MLRWPRTGCRPGKPQPLRKFPGIDEWCTHRLRRVRTCLTYQRP